MSFALLFSGQGSQHERMLRWLSNDDPLVRQTDELLRTGHWRAELADGIWAVNNLHAQVLLTGTNLAAWGQIAAELPPPAAIAGYSVGELAAFAAAGVFDAGTAICLARSRAEAMDRCAAVSPGGLMAVSDLLPAELDEVCAGRALHIAIRNSTTAVVLGGSQAALDEALRPLLDAGARCVRLAVSIASHTPSMSAASLEFAGVLSRVAMSKPRVPLFSCVADRVTTSAAAVHALAAQISNTLRWDECLSNIHERRVACVLEVGPGAALASMWNQRFPDVPARSIDEFEHRDAIVRWVSKHL